MPRPKKPTVLKLLSGTVRKGRDNGEAVSLPCLDSIPDPPSWLPNAEAVNEWSRLCGILAAVGLLSEAALSPLAVLCSLHGRITRAFAAGECPSGHLISQYRLLLADFALTPASSAKMGARPAKLEGNPFARFKRPPEKLRGHPFDEGCP